MIDAVIFPDRLVNEKSHGWNIRGSLVSPGQSQIGTFPRGRIDGGGLWASRINQIVLREDDDVSCYLALRSLAQGGSRALVVRRYHPLNLQPYPTINGVRVTSYPLLPHSDGSFFSDDSGYYQNVIAARTVGTALLRSTSLTIHLVSGAPLRGGEVFSILRPTNNWRMYEVTTVTVNGSGDSVVRLNLPLREDVPDGTEVEFDRPRCTMFLEAQSSMDVDMTTDPYPWPNASFIEYPWTAE